MACLLLYLNGDAQSKIPVDSITKSPSKVDMKTIPPDYCAKHLGFFCKEEIKRDKQTILPLRFRLGSMDYCNYLEQKPGYKQRQN